MKPDRHLLDLAERIAARHAGEVESGDRIAVLAVLLVAIAAALAYAYSAT